MLSTDVTCRTTVLPPQYEPLPLTLGISPNTPRPQAYNQSARIRSATMPNVFGATLVASWADVSSMQTDRTDRVVEQSDAPTQQPHKVLDVRELGPPKPLTETLETLADIDEQTVLVQVNDRAPQHLYPKLTDRDYEFETVTDDDVVLTTIWQAE